jgi:hypothetical protein
VLLLFTQSITCAYCAVHITTAAADCAHLIKAGSSILWSAPCRLCGIYVVPEQSEPQVTGQSVEMTSRAHFAEKHAPTNL